MIGGTACLLAMDELGFDFRATKDLDIVLCHEVADPEFAQALWAFIRDGGYFQRETAQGRREYFRFAKPTTPGFPAMLELFARAPESLLITNDQRIIPALRVLDAAADPLSLSAILLDDVYYQWLRAGRHVTSGLPIVRAEHLIPLKAKAWLELTARQTTGATVDQRAIRKHRNDVVRLTAIIDPNYRVDVPPVVLADMSAFITGLQQHPLDPATLGFANTSVEEVVRILTGLYDPVG